jgi:hypothetical protein
MNVPVCTKKTAVLMNIASTYGHERVRQLERSLRFVFDLEKPTPSASGKTFVVASIRGDTVTTAIVDG